MTGNNKRRTSIVAFATMLVVSQLSYAGVNNSRKGGGQGYTLQCWQYGVLIIKESYLAKPKNFLNKGTGSASFVRRGSDSVDVFAPGDGSLCLLKKGE